MEMYKNEFLSFLKELGLESISKNEKKVIYEKIENSRSLEQLKKEFELLFALNKVLISSYNKVSIGNMMKINEELDNQVIIKLFLIYGEIKNKSKDEVSSLKEFKEVASNILNLNSQTNNLIEKNVEDSVSKLVQIKNSLYLTMSDKDKADKLLDNCIRRSKNFISQSDVANLEYLINYLKKNYNLSDDELVNISKRCATFFSFSSSLKIENISKTIDEFRKFIEKKLIIDDKSIEVSKIINKDFKDILINTPSIAVNNPNAISKTIRFLTGDKLGDLVNTDYNFFDVRGDFTPLQLAKIYNESITSLSISVEKIADVCKNVSDSYEKYFNSKLNLTNLINGHNFSSIDQLSKDDYLSDGKINDIFKLLGMFISAEDMENLLKNNFSFLIAPISDVKKSLRNAVLNAQNEKELKKNILQKIRNHFDIYESYYAKGEVDSSKIKIESLSKVDVKQINENELIDILDRLNASDDDIEKFKKQWKKEEKEIKDLEIQINLEDILEQLNSIEDLLSISYVSEEQFINETMIVKNLYLEVVEKYEKIISENKISKKLDYLTLKVNQETVRVAKMIDDNINVVVNNYAVQLELLNKNLENINSKKNQYNDLLEKIKQKYIEIKESHLSIDEIIKNESKIKEVCECIACSKIKLDEAEKNEKKADRFAYQFFETLEIKGKNIFTDISQLELLKEGESDLALQFARSLYEEGLILYMEEFDDMDEKDIMPYCEFSLKKLDSDQKKLTDEVYNLYKINNDLRDEVFCSLMEYVDYYNLDSENIHTNKDAIAILNKKLRELSKSISKDRRIFDEKNQLEERINKINIEKLNSETMLVEDNINKLLKNISELSNKKICR